MPKFKVMILKVLTKKQPLKLEKTSIIKAIQLQKRSWYLIQKLQELTLLFMPKLKVMMLKVPTKKQLLK
jgi:hypothetical protein